MSEEVNNMTLQDLLLAAKETARRDWEDTAAVFSWDYELTRWERYASSEREEGYEYD